MDGDGPDRGARRFVIGGAPRRRRGLCRCPGPLRPSDPASRVQSPRPPPPRVHCADGSPRSARAIASFNEGGPFAGRPAEVYRRGPARVEKSSVAVTIASSTPVHGREITARPGNQRVRRKIFPPSLPPVGERAEDAVLSARSRINRSTGAVGRTRIPSSARSSRAPGRRHDEDYLRISRRRRSSPIASARRPRRRASPPVPTAWRMPECRVRARRNAPRRTARRWEGTSCGARA